MNLFELARTTEMSIINAPSLNVVNTEFIPQIGSNPVLTGTDTGLTSKQWKIFLWIVVIIIVIAIIIYFYYRYNNLKNKE